MFFEMECGRVDYMDISTFTNNLTQEKAVSIQNKGCVAGSLMKFYQAVAPPLGQRVHRLRADIRREYTGKTSTPWSSCTRSAYSSQTGVSSSQWLGGYSKMGVP